MVYPYNGILVSKIGINNMNVVLKSWHAAVHGVTKSWTQLSDLTELTIYMHIYIVHKSQTQLHNYFKIIIPSEIK